MNCREFSVLTKAFIFDEIEDKKVIMEYLMHARECKECYEELEVTYSMYRSLGDIQGPDGNEYSSDYVNELKQISEYYNELVKSERRNKYLHVLVIIIIIVLAVVAGICLLFEI